MIRMSVSGKLQDELNGLRELPPRGALARELASAGGSYLVELCAAAELGDSPFGFDESLFFEPVEGWIERALVHAECVVRDLLDATRNGPPVHWLAGERTKNEEVERALEELVGGKGHCGDVLLSTTYINTVMPLLSTGNSKLPSYRPLSGT